MRILILYIPILIALILPFVFRRTYFMIEWSKSMITGKINARTQPLSSPAYCPGEDFGRRDFETPVLVLAPSWLPSNSSLRIDPEGISRLGIADFGCRSGCTAYITSILPVYGWRREDLGPVADPRRFN